MSMVVVTLVGSMKFHDVIVREAQRFSEEGMAVMMPHKDSHEILPDPVKRMYDKQIRRCIDMSDMVFVVNVNGYIGNSVVSEIEYAVKKGIPVQYLEPLHMYTTGIPTDAEVDTIVKFGTYPVVTLIGSRRFKELFDIAEMRLTAHGYNVQTPGIFQFTEDEAKHASLKFHQMLDRLQETKLTNSEYVLIVDGEPGTDGCVGNDTRREIIFVNSMDKRAGKMFRTSQYGIDQLIDLRHRTSAIAK